MSFLNKMKPLVIAVLAAAALNPAGTWAGQAAGEQSGALPGTVLQDAMPVLKKGWLESERAFVNRAQDEAHKVLRSMFPSSNGDYGVALDFVWKCNSRDDFWDKSGVSGLARWEFDGWTYAAEVRACEGPLTFGYIAITPSDEDSSKMPGTREEFISLVDRLTLMRIDGAEEYEFLGNREFSKNLGVIPGRQVPPEIKTTHSSCGRPVPFRQAVGALFLKELEDADLRYFPELAK